MDWFFFLAAATAILVSLSFFGLIVWILFQRYIQKEDPLIKKTPMKRERPVIKDEKEDGVFFEPDGYRIKPNGEAIIRMKNDLTIIQKTISKEQIVCETEPFFLAFGKKSGIFKIVHDWKASEKKEEKDLAKFHHNLAQYFKSFEDERIDRRVEDIAKVVKAKHEKPSLER